MNLAGVVRKCISFIVYAKVSAAEGAASKTALDRGVAEVVGCCSQATVCNLLTALITEKDALRARCRE